jgi:hypothetical protein
VGYIIIALLSIRLNDFAALIITAITRLSENVSLIGILAGLNK